MKRTIILLSTLFLMLTLTQAPSLALNKKDCKEIVKITKNINKFGDLGKIDKIEGYYSENYKSFDGYGKKELLDIYETSAKLYPNSKTKERILKIEEEADKDIVKVYIDEISNTDIIVADQESMFSIAAGAKGRITSTSNYAILFKKEDGEWKIVGDEIYKEATDIRYGEALNSIFTMETPESLNKGEEFTVKTTLVVPQGRVAVGSIGHDTISYPPKKYLDPYRSIKETGVLERIMTANKEGKNEYANSTFAFIAPVSIKDFKLHHDIKRAAISGMGISVKRINIAKKAD